MNRKLLRHNVAGGFTLIEVMVVVAIIALLISILLPSLKSAREQSRSVLCGTQLNQIFKAVFSYTNDFKDVLPHVGFRVDQDKMKYLWFTQINRYLGNELEMFLCPSDQIPIQRDVAYDKSGRLKMADAESFPDVGDRPKFVMDVSYQGSCDLLSNDIKWEFPEIGELFPMPRKITDFKHPAGSILLLEGKDLSRHCDQCIRYYDLSVYLNSEDPPTRNSWRLHNNKSNFLFLDGCVGSLNPRQVYKEMRRSSLYIYKDSEHMFVVPEDDIIY